MKPFAKFQEDERNINLAIDQPMWKMIRSKYTCTYIHSERTAASCVYTYARFIVAHARTRVYIFARRPDTHLHTRNHKCVIYSCIPSVRDRRENARPLRWVTLLAIYGNDKSLPARQFLVSIRISTNKHSCATNSSLYLRAIANLSIVNTLSNTKMKLLQWKQLRSNMRKDLPSMNRNGKI